MSEYLFGAFVYPEMVISALEELQYYGFTPDDVIILSQFGDYSSPENNYQFDDFRSRNVSGLILGVAAQLFLERLVEMGLAKDVVARYQEIIMAGGYIIGVGLGGTIGPTRKLLSDSGATLITELTLSRQYLSSEVRPTKERTALVFGESLADREIS
ncbi:MAG: hypothetical protein ACHQUB_02665 [Candidatus Saccharimonadia bacterium]